MHGEWPQKARTPCILAFHSFIFAWEWPQKAKTPCNPASGSFIFCMGNGRKRPKPHAFLLFIVSYLHGNGRKRPDSHAFLLSRVSYLHGEWPPKARTPCNPASGSFIFAWGTAAKGQIPMQSSIREFHICMGYGRKRPEPHVFWLQKMTSSSKNGRGGDPHRLLSCTRRPKTAEENFKADDGSKGNRTTYDRKALTHTRNRGTTSTAISGVPEEHRHQTGFRDVPRRMCSAFLLLVVLPEDPLSAGNLPAVLATSCMTPAKKSPPRPLFDSFTCLACTDTPIHHVLLLATFRLV